MAVFRENVFSPWAFLWGAIAILIAYGLHTGYLWYRNHERPHIKALYHSHWHFIVGISVALIIGVTVGVTITKGLGLQYKPHLKIRPDARLLRFGSPYSYSMAQYLPNTVLDQGTANACVAFAMTMARWIEDNTRGENIPDVFSGFYTYYWVTGGANVPTSVESESNSISTHGVTLLGNMPYFGSPSQFAINSSREYGGGFQYLFYNYGGQGSLDSIKYEVSRNTPVVLLIQVNNSFQNAFGQAATDNSGGFVDYHAVVVYGYVGNSFYIRNSWGSGFGSGGNILLTESAMNNSIIGAVIMNPSPSIAWPRYIPPPLPTAKPKPRPRPSYITRADTHLRSRPEVRAATKVLVKKGSKLVDLKKQTASWRYLQTLSSHKGWILKSNLCPLRGCPKPIVHHKHKIVKHKPRIFLVLKNASLHVKPDSKTHGYQLVRKGSHVTYLGKGVAKWWYVRYTNKRAGWIIKSAVR